MESDVHIYCDGVELATLATDAATCGELPVVSVVEPVEARTVTTRETLALFPAASVAV
jgi:hypothetical protein